MFKSPDFGLHIWYCFEREYVGTYRGLRGLAPKVTGLENNPG